MSIPRPNAVVEMPAPITVVAAPACGPARLDRWSMLEVEQLKLHEEAGSGSTFVVSASNVLKSNLKAT
jgi:hypothetical protein